jgi:hypothetical protein
LHVTGVVRFVPELVLTHRIDAQVDLVIGAGVKNTEAEPVKGTCVKRTS